MRGGLSTALGAMMERLNPRERVLLGLMALVAVTLSCFLVIIVVQRSISTMQEQVRAQDGLLAQLRESAPFIRERLEESRKIGDQAEVEPPAIGTQLEAHASKAGMGDTVLEMVDQPEERVGSYIRKSVEVRLRRKPLGPLAEFWALTVNDKAQYPVAITRLTVRRRLHEPNSYDVDMIVSAYWPSRSPEPSKVGRGEADGAESRSKGRP